MIQIENLTKYYRNLCAVDRINLHISKGEILGLLGPNGAGKTTTLRMLTGFFRPTSGSIRVKDYAMRTDALKIKRIMGYLPESAPLYHSMLVYDYLYHVAHMRRIGRDAVITRLHRLADLCGLNDVMHKPVGELSRGYKQRAGLAQAMMSDPEILVLDEPTSGLDPNQIVEIRQIIKQIGREKTVILSTHILSEAEATCDRVVIINRGKIVADGSTADLKQSGNRDQSIKIVLLNADNHYVRQALETIDGVTAVDATDASNDMLKVNLTCHSETDLRPAVYRKIKQTDWILVELYQETKSLEKIFRELTKEN